MLYENDDLGRNGSYGILKMCSVEQQSKVTARE